MKSLVINAHGCITINVLDSPKAHSFGNNFIYDKIMSGSYFWVTSLEIQHIYCSVKHIENLTVYIFYEITQMQ